MIRKFLAAGMGILFLLALLSCSPTFTQPEVTYNSFALLELPGVYVKLQVNADVTNLDRRDADITKVVYTAVVEGISSEEMTYETPFTIQKGATTTMDMPLTFTTANALAILEKLDNGTLLEYSVTGLFTANTCIGPLELTLDTTGTAEVVVDINDYFTQPGVTVNKVSYTSGTSPYSGGLTLISAMDFVINATVKNNAAYAATLKSASYTVTLEGGLTSSAATYANSFDVAPAPASGSEVTRTDMPASFPVTVSNAAAFVTLASKIGSLINFTVSGTMTLTADIGAGDMDFVLPLSVAGTTTLEDATP